jgi:hypothetical protein
VKEVFELRSILDLAVVRLAIERASDEELDRILDDARQTYASRNQLSETELFVRGTEFHTVGPIDPMATIFDQLQKKGVKVLYEKPDKLRILGYHPFGMGVFDALYSGGEFVLFSPLQNRAYTGEISEFQNLIAKANVRISAEKPEGSDVPDRIRIEMPEKETRLDVKLKEISYIHAEAMPPAS